jgi:hypothetical protein
MLAASSRLLVQKRATLAVPFVRGVIGHAQVAAQRDSRPCVAHIFRHRLSTMPSTAGKPIEEEHGPIMRNAGKIASVIFISICTWLWRSSSANANHEEVKLKKWNTRTIAPHEINEIRRKNKIRAQDLVRVSEAVHTQFPGANPRATVEDFERVLRRELRSECATGLVQGVCGSPT